MVMEGPSFLVPYVRLLDLGCKKPERIAIKATIKRSKALGNEFATTFPELVWKDPHLL